MKTGPIAGGTFKAGAIALNLPVLSPRAPLRGEVCRTLHLEENRVGDQPSESVIGRVGCLECGL